MGCRLLGDLEGGRRDWKSEVYFFLLGLTSSARSERTVHHFQGRQDKRGGCVQALMGSFFSTRYPSSDATGDFESEFGSLD